MCREGYWSAGGVLHHLKDVKAPLDLAVELVGDGGVKIWAVGPKEELDKLKPGLAPLGTVFWTGLLFRILVTSTDGILFK